MGKAWGTRSAADPLTVACPKCKAHKGLVCTRLEDGAAMRRVHSERTTDAIAAKMARLRKVVS